MDAEGQSIFAGEAIPIGVFENGDGTVAAVSVDEDFLIGPEGAHLNVSGISGLAAKTSATQFILKSLLTHTGKRVAVVIFNLKSRDLLYIDRANPRIEQEPWSQAAYEALGIPAEPFSDAHFFAPADPKNPKATQSLRTLPTYRFEWDLQQIRDDMTSLFDQMDWDDKMEGVWHRIRDAIDQSSLHTYAQMLNWVNDVIATAEQKNNQWPLGNHIFT